METAADFLVPLVVMTGLIGSVAWVFLDAAAHLAHGRPIFFSAGPFSVEHPSAWAIGCLVLWTIAFPIYLTCRKNTDAS